MPNPFSWFFEAPLPVGSVAPDFTLPDETGKQVTLSGLRGSNVVLIWYPGDDTAVCRAQLCEFRDHWGEARRRNVLVFGVNPQGAGSHSKFREKRSLPFPLLIDKGQSVGRLYRTSGWIVRRTVYLAGPDGVIRFAKRGKPSADEVLAAAR